MRIISQDGLIDVPYEYGSLSVAIGKYEDVEYAIIKYRNVSSSKGTTLAEYKSKAKALKAMEMLREEYQFAKEFETICCGTTDYTSKPKYSFLFPSDEEIEV